MEDEKKNNIITYLQKKKKQKKNKHLTIISPVIHSFYCTEREREKRKIIEFVCVCVCKIFLINNLLTHYQSDHHY